MASQPHDSVISHWSQLVENLQTSPLQVYSLVEAAIQRREVPETFIERIEYKEGGAISARRTYLRIKRGRLAFDVCGAPFGTGFFFSTWLAEVPVLTALHKFAIFGALGLVFILCMSYSFFAGPLLFAALVFFALFLIGQGDMGFDEVVMELPVIGILYAKLFKPITYYRLDTAAMFQAAVQAAVLETIDELTSAQGLRMLSELERKPLMHKLATA